jgi:hypothetical protein
LRSQVDEIFETRRFAMMQATQRFKRLKFGVFEADFRTGELTKHGKRIRLQEQPFQQLVLLRHAALLTG